MDGWPIVFALTLFAGMAIPMGAWLARIESIRPQWLETEFRHGVIAFGGGALLSAVALVLVPEGVKDLTIVQTAVCFSLGGAIFMGLDIAISRSKGAASQLIAMLADFIPEALALGATFAADRKAGALLAFLMALQNLPEGFNAFREIATSTRIPKKRILYTFVLLSFLGPISGLSGYFLLTDEPKIVSEIMLFAAGGILYITMRDIAPQAKLERHWAPSLGAVAGFLLGLIGESLLR